ncbi:PEP-CTERM sorting domain-containing protein [Edaphobacter aggregans]|uniref:PEP-CTERM sorting domain-containing protein n=1 Tax=Edaphobacter aggregans TaxID=570835 RepID=UPI000557CF42|nr:PEP-CTERM sorting domain-containing protein [Edaphobacter aggregans]
MKKSALSLFTLLLAAVVALPVAAHADTINFALTSPVQTGSGGSTLTFEATVSVLASNSGAVSLISDTFTIPGTSPFTVLNIDDSSFFNNFPLALNPGESFTGTLFTLTLPGVIAPGVYGGNFVALDLFDEAGLETFATQEFIVSVPGSSPVPEPGTWVLLVTGAGALAGVVYSRRRTMASGIAA